MKFWGGPLLCGFLLSLSISPQRGQALSIARSPIHHVSVLEDINFSQPPQTLTTASTFDIDFGLSDERRRVLLRLHPTSSLLSHQTHVQYVASDGLTTRSPSQDPILVYKGVSLIRENESQSWAGAGWARITVRSREGKHLIEGAFTVDGEHYHIQLDSNFRPSGESSELTTPKPESPYMVVWKEVDGLDKRSILEPRAANESSCNTANANQNSFLDAADTSDDSILARQNNWFDPTDVIGSRAGCPTSRVVAMIGIAADCTYTADFGSMEDARANIISQINIASQVYEDTFNISLAIRNLTLSDSACPTGSTGSNSWNRACSAGLSVSDRLSEFSSWRSRNPDSNAIWSLMSTCASGSTVGLAWVGTVCRSRTRSWRSRTSGSAANIVVRTNAEWQVFAHELAHNFGANHDCTSDSCSGTSATDGCCPLSASSCDSSGQYIMSPRSGRNLRDFSPCTIGSICTAMSRDLIDTSCLVSEADAPDINASQCGNGIVEAGEACDCGGPDGCPQNSCCNPNTCQLRSGAQCDPVADACCTGECQVAPSGQVCRASTGLRDPEETCDGNSSRCPEDENNSSGNNGNNNNNGNTGGGGGNNGNGGSGGDWLERNRNLVIGLSVGVGGFILAAITLCIVCSCARRHRKAGTRLQRNRIGGVAPNVAPGGGSGVVPTGQIPAPPPMVHRYA